MRPLLTLAFLLIAGSAWGDATMYCRAGVFSCRNYGLCRTYCDDPPPSNAIIAVGTLSCRRLGPNGSCDQTEADREQVEKALGDRGRDGIYPGRSAPSTTIGQPTGDPDLDDFIITWCGVVSHGDPIPARCAHPATPSTAMEHDSVTCDSLHPVGSGGCLPGSSAPARRTYSADDVNRMRKAEASRVFDESIVDLVRQHPTDFDVIYHQAVESRVQTDILAGIGPDDLEKAK